MTTPRETTIAVLYHYTVDLQSIHQCTGVTPGTILSPVLLTLLISNIAIEINTIVRLRTEISRVNNLLAKDANRLHNANSLNAQAEHTHIDE